MFRLVITLVLAATLGGCGESKTDAFVSSCVETTELETSVCECIAERASAELSEDGFEMLSASMAGDQDRVIEASKKLGVSEAMEAGLFMSTAPAKCALGD